MGRFNLRVAKDSLVALVVPFDLVVVVGVVRTTVAVSVGPPAMVVVHIVRVSLGIPVPAVGYSVQL